MMVDLLILMAVLLFFLSSVYIIGIKLKKKKQAGILLIVTFFFMILYVGIDYFPKIGFDNPVTKYYIVVDLQSPTDGTFYITEDEIRICCPHEPESMPYLYDMVFAGLMSLQYKSIADWTDATVDGKSGMKIGFTALEPQRFQFRTASFSTSPMDTDSPALYEAWRVKVIFPENYKLDKEFCEGPACDSRSFSTEDGRDVMEFESNGFFGLKVLYQYEGQ